MSSGSLACWTQLPCHDGLGLWETEFLFQNSLLLTPGLLLLQVPYLISLSLYPWLCALSPNLFQNFLSPYHCFSSPYSILTLDSMVFLAMTTPTTLGKRPSFKPCMTLIAQAEPCLYEEKSDIAVSKSGKLSTVELKFKENKKGYLLLCFDVCLELRLHHLLLLYLSYQSIGGN